MEPQDRERLARIDENVKRLLKLPERVESLETDSAINKQHHRVAIWFFGIIATPAALWICKKLGVPIF